ncbi:alkaline phosphatase, partial [Vibrio sp. FNV 38]|nr:alkaline phosphatase [Vibrio sp. FNV 38]
AYDLDRDPAKEPSLAEMTTKAIDVLAAKKKGFFLMVEGGRIDHALHETTARKALQDTVAFDAAIRSALDNDCICIVLKETNLKQYFDTMPWPNLVVTDSQAFGMVSKIVPEEVPLTSFSILLARLRGDFENYLKGTPYLAQLQDGDK